MKVSVIKCDLCVKEIPPGEEVSGPIEVEIEFPVRSKTGKRAGKGILRIEVAGVEHAHRACRNGVVRSVVSRGVNVHGMPSRGSSRKKAAPRSVPAAQ